MAIDSTGSSTGIDARSIDFETFLSTPVAGGACYALTSPTTLATPPPEPDMDHFTGTARPFADALRFPRAWAAAQEAKPMRVCPSGRAWATLSAG